VQKCQIIKIYLHLLKVILKYESGNFMGRTRCKCSGADKFGVMFATVFM